VRRGAILLLCGALAPARASEIACESSTLGGDMFDVRCPLPATRSAQRYRYEVHFSGGHDDTRASLSPALDGSVIACDEADSQLRLLGEEGDVSLACEFEAGGGSPAPVFSVRVLWHHCQHEGASLVAVP
jgi:hypothetical protein